MEVLFHMRITGESQTRSGNTTFVTVVSSLSGTIYYHWYIDKSYVGMTTAPTRAFVLLAGDQVVIDCIDTNDADFDPITDGPSGFPCSARRSIVFYRSLATDIDKYRVESRKNAGSWTAIGTVADDPRRWEYTLLSPRLDDLAAYEFRVVPIDQAGNDGTPVALASEKIVRTPDAPTFSLAFDAGTTKVTIS